MILIFAPYKKTVETSLVFVELSSKRMIWLFSNFTKKGKGRKELFITSFLILERLIFHLLPSPRQFCKINDVEMLNKACLFSFQSFAFCAAGGSQDTGSGVDIK